MKQWVIWLAFFLIVLSLAFFVKKDQLTNNPHILNQLNQVAKISDIVFLPLFFKSSTLPHYQLLVNPQDLLRLEQSLPDVSLTKKTNNFPLEIPATLITDNQSYPVTIRNRGNFFFHWAFAKKSWRIKFSNNQSHQGLNSIDFIIPEDRGLVLEHLANFRAKNLGLLAPKSWFATLSINQENHGLYYLTEKIDQNFLETRNLPGVIFTEKDIFTIPNNSLYQSIDYWRSFPDKPDEKTLTAFESLIDLINDSDSTSQDLTNLINLDKFLSWQVHSLLMASFAQNGTRNNQLYYDPETEKFEFIPWDTGGRHDTYEALDRDYHPLVNKLLKDPEIKRKRNQLLLGFINNQSLIQKDQDFFQTHLDQIYFPLIKDTKKLHPNLKYIKDIKNYQSWRGTHLDFLANELNHEID